MNLENYLSYITHRSESIIQWLFFAILILSGALIARALFAKKVEEPKSGGVDLQTALQKIMEQTTKLESVSLEKLNSQGVAQVEAQLQALKSDLASREAELSQLKASGGGAATTTAAAAMASSVDADKLGERIKELEAKLSEYEILEDDIADLSLYKEENSRLRVEIDKLKGPGGGAPASGESIVEEFAQAVNQPPMDEGVATPAAVAEIPDTGDPMADFESTMNLEKQLEEAPAVASAPPVAAAPPTPPMVAESAAPAAAQAEADDLFAEFSSGGEETLDTDKMMAEMAALVSMEPATGSSLEESIDTEKMAAEATSLSKA